MVCRKLVCFSVSCKCRMFLGVTQNIFRFHVSNMSYVCIVLSKKFSFYAFWFNSTAWYSFNLYCVSVFTIHVEHSHGAANFMFVPHIGWFYFQL